VNRPDSGSQDQGANQDDAVWLDLVARLQADFPDEHAQAASGQQDPDTSGVPERSPAPGRGPSFRDFDPLGLAGAPPTELSAAERSSAAERQGAAAGEDSDAGAPAGPRDYDTDDADDDGFVPEEPPSLAGTDPLTMLAWLAAVGGPVALLLSAMFWRSAPLLAILGIVAAFVLGTVYLIMKLPQEKDGDDDGARV